LNWREFSHRRRNRHDLACELTRRREAESL
jgi:hypothetical protein